jgi:hypothetical protein
VLKIERESKTEAAKESGTKSNIERAMALLFVGIIYCKSSLNLYF